MLPEILVTPRLLRSETELPFAFYAAEELATQKLGVALYAAVLIPLSETPNVHGLI